MIPKLVALAVCLSCATTVLAAEPASAASAAQTSSPRLINHCEAYRDSVNSGRTPRDLGSVRLRFEVSPQGQVVESEILEHTTTTYFAHVVQENFSRCLFEPARENGLPVQRKAVLAIDFQDQPHAANNAVCPDVLLRERAPGTGPMVSVKLRVRFLQSGHVAAVDVLQSSAVPALDEAAVKAYRQCYFDPGADKQPAFQEEWITTLKWG